MDVELDARARAPGCSSGPPRRARPGAVRRRACSRTSPPRCATTGRGPQAAARGRAPARGARRAGRAPAARPGDRQRPATRCVVERERALFGAWYEFFPRSEGAARRRRDRRAARRAPSRTAAERLPAVADMGFDVVYLPPIHPIGSAVPQGPQQHAGPRRPTTPASPWAIGSDEGGHDAIHPDLGTLEDFDAFVARTARSSAWRSRSTWRCSAPPTTRGCTSTPSGSPPGPTARSPTPRTRRRSTRTSTRSTSTTTPRASTPRCCAIVRLLDRPRRADLPGRQPAHQAGRVLGVADRARSRATDPDVIFLAEAFTRPAMMHTLGKVGFHAVLHVLHLAQHEVGARGVPRRAVRRDRELHAAQLLRQHPGHPARVPAVRRPGRRSRSGRCWPRTLSPSWGVYSGYELCEHVAVRPGSEEYLDYEKYQYRPRDWAARRRDGPQPRAVPDAGSTDPARSTRRCSSCGT